MPPLRSGEEEAWPVCGPRSARVALFPEALTHLMQLPSPAEDPHDTGQTDRRWVGGEEIR